MKKLNNILSILLIVSMAFSSSGTYVLAESVGNFAKTDNSISHKDYEENTESIEADAIVLIDKKDEIDESESEPNDNTTTSSTEEAEATTVITSDITESTKKEIVDEENIATNSDVDSDSVIIDKEKEENNESVATNSGIDTLLFGDKENEASASETDIPTISMFKKYLGNIDDNYVAPKVENGNLFGADPLPSRWDSREHNNTTTGLSYVPPIRWQSPYGMCWAFATAGMFETSIRKKGLATTEEESNLSELALAYFMYNLKGVTSDPNYAGTPGQEGDDYTAINPQYYINRGEPENANFHDCGGNQGLSTKMLTSFVGMVVEDSVTEFSNDGTKNEAMLNAELNGLPSEYAFNKNGYIPKDIKYINKDNKEQIKKAIMENGSVGFSYYAEGDDNLAFHWDDDGSYYHSQNRTSTNHAVMIIGWDDNIDAKKFYYGGQGAENVNWQQINGEWRAVGTNPPTDSEYDGVMDTNYKSTSNGAWLVRNSYGIEQPYYLKDGYFYIPYDEPSLSSTFYTVDAIKANTYKYNYHYDTTGANCIMEAEVYGNIFKVAGDDTQLIEAVNVGIDDANKEYDIKIYIKETEMENPTDGTLVATKRCSNELAGFYTFELDTPVAVAKDTYFSIVLEADEDNPICMFADYTEHYDGSWYHTYNEIHEKQSFTGYKNDNNVDWSSDLSSSLTETINGKTYGRVVRLKAYGNSGVAISFNANGGEGIMHSQSVTSGIATLINKCLFKKAGYRFSHWVDSFGNEYEDGAEITITDSIILTAEWDEAYYLLSPNWYNETISGMPEPNITSIKIIMYPTASPSNIDASWNIPRSDGLIASRKGTNVYIYAPDTSFTGKIDLPADSSYLFSKQDMVYPGYADWDHVFSHCDTLEGLDLLNTSNVTNMKRMFAGLGNLNMFDDTMMNLLTNPKEITIDLSGFNTGNVTDMSLMFEQAAIKNIDVSSFDTRCLTNTSWMFAQCGILQNLDLSSFGTATISNASGMFELCQSLSSINLNGATFENARNISNMFSNCSSIIELDLRSFCTSNVIEIENMFANCTNLRRIIVNEDTFILDNVDSAGVMLSLHGIFANSTSLTGAKGTTIASVVASGIPESDAIGITYARVDKTGIPGYFTSAPAKEYILSPSWFNASNTNIDKSSVTKIIISMFPEVAPIGASATWEIVGSNGLIGYTKGTEIIIYAPEEGSIYMDADSEYLFSDSGYTSFNNLTEIVNLRLLDTSRVLSMEGMFSGCQMLTSVDLSNFDTSHVTNMSKMFYFCRFLENVDVTGFDTSNVENFYAMFFACMYLTQIDVSSFNTSNATNMSGMFNMCSGLMSINVSGFNTSNVEDMSYMFAQCRGITTLNLSNFDTRNVTTMAHMFHFLPNTSHITMLDLSSFDTSNVNSMTQMFYNCNSLRTIIASNRFVTTGLIARGSYSYMFEGCINLVGGNNTEFSNDQIDKLYARIDGKSNLPGYFTGKNMVAVTFDYDGKGTNYVEVFNKGSAITEPTSPTTTGFTFVHWYKEGTSDTVAYNFADLLPQDNTKKMKLIAKWAPTVYTINYDAGTGATVSPTSFTKTYGDPITTDLAVPTKPGYTFDNWYTDTTYTTAYNKTNDDIYVLGTSTYTIHAKFNPNQYTVDYDLGGVGATKPATITKTFDSPLAAGTLVNPTNIPDGYTFAGWYKESTYASEWTGNDDLTNDTTTQTIYARWKATITYDANGHGTAPSPVDVILGQNTTLPSISNVTGFSFDTTNSWYDGSDISTATLVGAASTDYTVNEPKRLYARWNENEYNIAYDRDGGSWASGYDPATVGTDKRKYSEEKILPVALNISKTGYTFLGWYKQGDTTETIISKINANIDEAVSVKAKWSENTYNITLNKNGGDYVVGYNVPSTRLYSESKTLPTNDDIKKVGHRLEGWHEQENFSDTAVLTVAANTASHKTFYAKWVPETYGVTLNTNGGTINAGDVSSYTYGTAETLPTDVTKAGSVFKGWWTGDGTDDNWGTQVSVISATDTGIKTYYARWSESYVVTFNLTTGTAPVESNITNKPDAQNVESGGTAVRPAVIPQANNFEFVGWYDFTLTTEYNFSTPITGATTIYAKWNNVSTYEVTFNLISGTVHPTALTDITGVPETQYIVNNRVVTKPTNPTATGYKFVGWYTDDTFGTVWNFENDVVTEPKTIYGKWELQKYTITYIRNDGEWATGFEPIVERLYGALVTLPTSAEISKYGYEFVGWFENSDFTNQISEIASNFADNKTVYASWTRLATTKIITFNDGYSGATAEQAFVVGDNNEIRTNVFARPGYTFIRWKDIAGNVYFNTSQLTDDITFYAEWQQNPAINPTPQYNSGNTGSRRSSSGGSGGSGGSGRGTGGSITQNQQQQQNKIQSVAQQVEVSTMKSEQIVVNGNASNWIYNPISNSWKLFAIDLMGAPRVAINGFYILNQVLVSMENNNLVIKTVQDTYYFDALGDMVTGWVKTKDDKWYFFNNEKTLDEGKLCIGWKQIDGYWYFFSSNDGSMLINTITPDGYKIGFDGKWIQ